jgi:hypothetical protein
MKQVGPAVLATPRPLGQPFIGGSTVDHLDDIKRIRQQLAAALAALPHDYDEGAQRILAADIDLATLEADGEREQADLGAYFDACEREEVFQ